MATSKETVAYILDQLAPLPVRAKAMFGEYGAYCNGKSVAVTCDDTLYVKPSPVAGEFASGDWLAEPYPQAKPRYAVPGERLEDRDWLQAFVAHTAATLPPPKPKAAKRSR